VIATARNISSLNENIDPRDVRLLTLDITSTAEDLEKAIDQAISIYGYFDVLVNNAGYVVSGVWQDLRYLFMPGLSKRTFFSYGVHSPLTDFWYLVNHRL